MNTQPIVNRYIPKYTPGQVVYALMYSNEDTNKTLKERNVDDFDINFAKICKVEILSIDVSKSGIYYIVCTPDTTTEWNEPLEEKILSDDKQVLINKLIEKWDL